MLVRRHALALSSEDRAERDRALVALKRLYLRKVNGARSHLDSNVARVALSLARAAMRNSRGAIRIAGVLAVELFAPHAREYVPDLERLFRDEDVAVRVAAVAAISDFGRFASLSRGAVRALVRMVTDGSTVEERAAAANALASSGPPPSAAAVLVRALIADEPRVQAAAAGAIQSLLEDPRSAQRSAASNALSALRDNRRTTIGIVRTPGPST